MKVLLILTAVLHLGWLQEAPEPFQIPNICTEMGPDQGSCGDYNVRWFFNPEDGQCKQFMYSGCGGNENNFKTLQDCEQMCKGGVQVPDGQQKQTGGEEQTGVSELPPNIDEDQGEPHQPEASEPTKDVVTTDKENTDNADDKEYIPEQDDEDDDDDDDDLDDGEEDDDLIKKYLNVGDHLDIEDSQMLKEAMAKFDVSVLKEVNEEEANDIDMEEQWNPEHQEQQEPQQLGEQQPMQRQEQQQQLQQQQQVAMQEHDNHEQDMQERQPQEMPTEQAVKEDQQTDNNEERQGEYKEEETKNVDEDNKEQNNRSNERIENDEENNDGDEDEDDVDDDDEFLDDNGKEVESFLVGLGGEISPEDREMVIEGVARFGATMLKKPEEIDDSMEEIPYNDETFDEVNEGKTASGDTTESQQELNRADKESEEVTSGDSKTTQSPNVMASENSVDEEDRNAHDGAAAAAATVHDDDEEAEGIDIDVEYPAIKGMISAEDRRTLAEAMNAFDVVEAITDGRKISDEVVARIPMKSPTEDDEAQRTNTDEANTAATVGMEENKAEREIRQRHSDHSVNTHNTGDMNAEDRKMLKELVSNYDVNVVEGNQASAAEEVRADVGQNTREEESTARDAKATGLLSPRCTLPPSTGPCRARKLRWFFDLETGACTTFVYGGCRGNGNRFPSREKCLASCLGEHHQAFRSETPTNANTAPINKPGVPVMPTQSPTKKITFMMPLLSFFNKRFPSLPTVSPIGRQRSMGRGNPLRGQHPPATLLGGEAVTVIRHASLGINSRQEGNRPELGEMTNDDIRPPFSPLRYMIMRAMLRPASRDVRLGVGQPAHRKPTNVRIIMPRLQRANVPSFQSPQPVAKPSPIRAPVDRTRTINRGYSPFRETLEDEQEQAQTRGVFSPKMVRKSEFESMSHDNKHFNNVSPNNKFTLLQVFVNKHNGRQHFGDGSRRTRLPVDPPKVRSPEPLGRAQKSLMYPIRSPYGSYPGALWSGPMPYHYHQQPAVHGYPGQVARPPMPFSPAESFGLPMAPPMPRRPVALRPVLVASPTDGERRNGAKARYSCLLPLAPGRCKSYQTKWYFNRISGKCEIFYYTGCAGNANNFETWEQCAATCLESAGEPMSTAPPHLRLKPDHDDDAPAGDNERDTIIITSTRYPENEAEEKQAMEDAKTESPSVDQQVSSTTEKLEAEKDTGATEEKDTDVAEEKDTDVTEEKDSDFTQNDNEVLHERQVIISEASAMSTHYIMLLAVITVVALAIIVLVTMSIVHLCRKMRANKKERILEAVIKQQMCGEVPNVIYTAKPVVEQTDKSQA